MLLPPEAATSGEPPLVRIRPNWSVSVRVAVNVKVLPPGPASATTCVSVVPSENVHVIVTGAAPGEMYPGEHDGLLYSLRLVPKILEAAASAEGKLLVL